MRPGREMPGDHAMKEISEYLSDTFEKNRGNVITLFDRPVEVLAPYADENNNDSNYLKDKQQQQPFTDDKPLPVYNGPYSNYRNTSNCDGCDGGEKCQNDGAPVYRVPGPIAQNNAATRRRKKRWGGVDHHIPEHVEFSSSYQNLDFGQTHSEIVPFHIILRRRSEVVIGNTCILAYTGLLVYLAHLFVFPRLNMLWFEITSQSCGVGAVLMLAILYHKDPAKVNPRALESHLSCVKDLESGGDGTDEHSPLVSNGNMGNNDWCRTCKAIKATIDTHHCRTCNVCVRKFDHHCGVLGRCIGGLNQRYFISLLLFACGANLHLFCAQVYLLATYTDYRSVSMYVFTLVVMWFAVGFAFFSGQQLYVICADSTSYMWGKHHMRCFRPNLARAWDALNVIWCHRSRRKDFHVT